MLKTRHSLRACAVAAAAALSLPALASAAPATVTLRVEGPDSTVYEGPVTTDVSTFRFSFDNPSSAANETTPVTCDGVGGTATTPSPTVGAVLVASGLKLGGTSFSFGPFVGQIGEVVAPSDFSAFFNLVVNGTPAQLGICGVAVKSGDDVLLAYGSGSEGRLKLAGVPSTLAPGTTATAKVTDQTGAPVAGALIDGRTTAADGTVQVGPFTSTGPRILKASKPGAVRSNGGQVCVTDGADGACGTVKPIAAPAASAATTTTSAGNACVSFGADGRCGTLDEMPALVRLLNVTSKTYAKADAPREIKGEAGNFKDGTTFLADPSGIKDVKLRITRYVGARCLTYDGTAERFTPLRSCGTGKGAFFSVGAKSQFSYLLPSALKPGKYRIEAFAVDGKGNSDKVRRWNRNHVVFRVK